MGKTLAGMRAEFRPLEPTQGCDGRGSHRVTSVMGGAPGAQWILRLAESVGSGLTERNRYPEGWILIFLSESLW